MECIAIINCIAGIVSACAGVYCAVLAKRIKATANAIKNDVGSSEAKAFIDSFLSFESLVDDYRLNGEGCVRKKDVDNLYAECKSLIKEVRKNRVLFSDDVFEKENSIINNLISIMQVIREGYELDEIDYEAIFEKTTPYLNSTFQLINEIIIAVRNS